MSTTRNKPFTNFRFVVDVEDGPEPTFTEPVTPPNFKTTRVFPDIEITLERGVDWNNDAFYEWLFSALGGSGSPRERSDAPPSRYAAMGKVEKLRMKVRYLQRLADDGAATDAEKANARRRIVEIGNRIEAMGG